MNKKKFPGSFAKVLIPIIVVVALVLVGCTVDTWFGTQPWSQGCPPDPPTPTPWPVQSTYTPLPPCESPTPTCPPTSTPYVEPSPTLYPTQVPCLIETPTPTLTPSPTDTPTATPTDTPAPAGQTYVVPNSISTVNGTGNFEHVRPGDRLLIPSSRTGPITFKNLTGEEGNQIIIINDGGKVGINANGSWAGVQIRNCEYVRLTGTGDPSVEYGFEIYNSSNCGITAYSKTRHVEIDHVEIHDVDKAGMYAKTPEDIRDTWIQYGTYIHHNYVHDVGTEGLYVGSSSWEGGKEPELEGVEISYNRIERCGYDGIQVGSAVADVKVHHNFVKDIGLEKPYGGGCAKAGFVINKGTTGDFYNNTVVNTGRWGFVILGLGHYRIYNNIIADAGGKPGSSDDAGIRWLGAGAQDGLFYNNTIVRTRGDGVKVSAGGDGAIYDNIVLGSSGVNIINKNAAKYNNIESGAVGAVGFVDPDNNDFHLLPSSSAVDAGSDTGFAPFDYDGVSRPQGRKSDIGAFER